MTTPSPRTLTQMQRRTTSYEVAVTAGGVTTRLAFTARRTRGALLSIAQDNVGQVLALIDDPDNADGRYSSTTGWTFGSARVHFTGRTEREVASAMGRIV